MAHNQRHDRKEQQQLLGREVEPGLTTRNKFNEWLERVLNPETPDLKASILTTEPHCLFSKPFANQIGRKTWHQF